MALAGSYDTLAWGSSGEPTSIRATLTEAASVSIYAFFTPYFQAVAGSGGTVTCSSPYGTACSGYIPTGTVFHVTATPSSGYYFTGWTKTGTVCPTEPCTYSYCSDGYPTVTDYPCTLTANFAK